MTVDEAIAEVNRKAAGRTRYEGSPPWIDEILVEEIDRLRAARLEMLEALRLSVGRFQAISDLVSPGLNDDIIAHSLAAIAKAGSEA